MHHDLHHLGDFGLLATRSRYVGGKYSMYVGASFTNIEVGSSYAISITVTITISNSNENFIIIY